MERCHIAQRPFTRQVLYKYVRNWSQKAQRNILWRVFKLAYTQITLQYLGTMPSLCGPCLINVVYPSFNLRLSTQKNADFCTGAAFMTLFLKEALAVWRSMHSVGHFMIAAILLIGFVFPPRSPRKAQPANTNGEVPVTAAAGASKQD